LSYSLRNPGHEESAVGCCEATNPNLLGVIDEAADPPGIEASSTSALATPNRRTVLKSLLVTAGGLAAGACRSQPAVSEDAKTTKIRLAFCGQLLCVVPYEVARVRGHFAAEGLDVELIYTRGGSAAMQALVGGAVEYAGTSFDVALQAVANGAAVRRFVSTGRLPLFALAVAPGKTGTLTTVTSLSGTTVGVSALGNADHALLLYLFDRAGVDAKGVRIAVIGPNAFDAVRIGQVDAAMVQEPALSLIVAAGGRELVNFMDLEQARQHLGGTYEFMGVAVRARERDRRLPEMRRLASALARGLADTRTLPAPEVVSALPKALVAGGDVQQVTAIIERYRLSLYPEAVAIDAEAAERVAKTQEVAGLLKPGAAPITSLLDTAALKG
jgi:NitT/TauT family transport system substrate-binding protein